MLAIGMDVHSSKTTAYAVSLEESDLELCDIAEEFNVRFRHFESTPSGYGKVAEFLKDVEHSILIENSTKSHEVYWILTDLGCVVMVAHVTDLLRITKSKKKTDQHDCFELAHYMRRRMLGEIEFSECLIVDGKWMNRRQMCRLYAQESDLLSDTRRQLRTFLLLRGGAVPNLAKDIVSAKNLEQMELDADETLSILLTRARDSRKRLMKCEKAIRKEFSEDPTYQSIYSIPGFGLVTSAYLSSLIVDITRFRSAKAFAAYLGIVPAQRDSGESAPHCHITRRGDARAREMLMKGVLIHIREDRDKESTVTQMYDRLLSRGFPKRKALMAACNKMSRLIYRVLTTGERFWQ